MISIEKIKKEAVSILHKISSIDAKELDRRINIRVDLWKEKEILCFDFLVPEESNINKRRFGVDACIDRNHDIKTIIDRCLNPVMQRLAEEIKFRGLSFS